MIETIRKTIQKRSTAAMAVFLLLCLLTAGCGGQSAKQIGVLLMQTGKDVTALKETPDRWNLT